VNAASPVARGARYALLDVFTDTPLQGNQLAVFLDARAISAASMQPLARELNLSETVYVLAPERGGDARIRIFTPTAELAFAGHPVLGTAIALGAERGLEHVTLETGAGVVPVALRGGGEGGEAGAGEDGRGAHGTQARAGARVGYGSMLQPIPTWQPFEREAELLAALGVERSGLPVEAYVNGPRQAFVELESEDAVAAVAPDMRALAELGAVGANCFAGAGRRWKTRNFAPGLGIAEDPATGSAAGPLAVHLARHGRISFGDEIEIRQGAETGRPSLLRARAVGSRDAIERVEVSGAAVIVARGEFSL
jgi:trans-2,3-dihydro-3-hydroxyanthranilate isomerase